MKKTLQECKEIVSKESNLTFPTRKDREDLIDLANKMYYEQSEWILIEDNDICKKALIDILDKINSNPSLPLLQDIREVAKEALKTNFIITP